MKKSIEELQKIRELTLSKLNNRSSEQNYRIVVGMATCGIAAGARPVLDEFMKQIAERKLSGITISQTGCVGLCVVEPIVEVYDRDGNKTTYIKMNPERVERVVEEHLIGGKIVNEYLLSVIDDKMVTN